MVRSNQLGGISAVQTIGVLGCLLAGTAAPAIALTMAEQFQQGQSLDAFPQSGPLYDLARNLPRNEYRDWPVEHATPPPGTPLGATRVLISETIQRYPCGGCLCRSYEFFAWITFSDGSQYSYDYTSTERNCPGESREHFRKIIDVAEMGNAFRARSKAVETLDVRGGTTTSSIAWRAPMGGTIALSGSQQSLVDGMGSVEIRTGPGGTLDLRGNSGAAPIMTTAAPATIYATAILLDPGVTLAGLFSPPPTVLPGTNVKEARVVAMGYPCGLGSGSGTARFAVWSFCNNAESIGVSWVDTLGWVAPGGSPSSIGPAKVGKRTFDVLPPGSPQIGDISTLTVTALPAGGPASVYDMHLVFDADSDGDGVRDTCDLCPAAHNASQSDEDVDGLGDACDLCPTVFDEYESDVDSDGVGAACDNCPILANADQADCDSDGFGDACDADQPPSILDDPDSQSLCAGGTITLSVTVQNASSFQWRRNGVAIDGATTHTYSVAPALPGHSGTYECVITGGCGSITSPPATVTVFAAGGGDVNQDGQLNGLDIQDFVDALLAGGAASPEYCAADLDGDGDVTPDDVFAIIVILMAF